MLPGNGISRAGEELCVCLWGVREASMQCVMVPDFDCAEMGCLRPVGCGTSSSKNQHGYSLSNMPVVGRPVWRSVDNAATAAKAGPGASALGSSVDGGFLDCTGS